MAKMHVIKVFSFSLIVLLSAFTAYLITSTSSDKGYKQKIHLLGGAGLMKPIEELATSFEKKHQVEIVVHYGGAGELMAQLATGQHGDVFLPGANKYVDDANEKGWIAKETIRDLVRHVPALAVAPGNPKQIRSLRDLSKPGISLALGDPEGCAIGRVAESILSKNKLNEKTQPNIRVRTPTVNQLLLYVTLSKVDAAIIWEDMVSWSKTNEKLAIIPIPDEQNIIKNISIAVTAQSKNKELAKMFCDFADSEMGLRTWSKWGFRPWAE